MVRKGVTQWVFVSAMTLNKPRIILLRTSSMTGSFAWFLRVVPSPLAPEYQLRFPGMDINIFFSTELSTVDAKDNTRGKRLFLISKSGVVTNQGR